MRQGHPFVDGAQALGPYTVTRFAQVYVSTYHEPEASKD